MRGQKIPQSEFQEFRARVAQHLTGEGVDLTQPGTYSVRAKGTLKIHGIEQERVVPCTVVVAPEGVRVTAAFDVAVADHGIRIPRIVQQKIAAVIKVKVDVLFKNDKGK